MAAKPISMSTLKQIILLYSQKTSVKQIVRITGISRNTVRQYIRQVEDSPELLENLLKLEDAALESVLFGKGSNARQKNKYGGLQARLEYFYHGHTHLKITKYLLWLEYKEQDPDGYQYTQFCHHLQQLELVKKVSMVIDHQPADALYVDFTGRKAVYIDKETGEMIKAELFVATLGFSQYSYVEAVASQSCEDFIHALNHALAYFGGVPARVVPDNLKAAVIKSNRYEPVINRILEDWANHNQTAIVPARSYKPKDKSLVENFVKQTYNRILNPLREIKFFSLKELNAGLLVRLDKHNEEKFRKADYSRKDLFLGKEKPFLKLLPLEVFQMRKYKTVTVRKNSYIEVSEDKNYYSIPYQYIGMRVWLCYTVSMIRVYFEGTLIAQHLRCFKKSAYTTLEQHLPSYYKEYKDRSPEYYISKAAQYDPLLEQVFIILFESARHPEQKYKSCQGILSLSAKHERGKFISVCRQAITFNACHYSFISKALEHFPAEADDEKPLPKHNNIRGKANYQ